MTYNFEIKKDLEKIAQETTLESIQNLYKEFLMENTRVMETHILSHERSETSKNKRRERVASNNAMYISDSKWFYERITLYPDPFIQNL